ncbi:MAG: ABC transporter ATP-binding protein [Saprospiraceae bacterium]|nr:ABC transporter ATP-binding protein [Saprospiraceae bacterium]
MIQAAGIHKSYGNLKVLKGVDLSIEQGEIVCVVGKSGTGKSTLLHILGTLDNADEGKVVLDGQATEGLGKKQLADFRNQKIGFVFQFHHLLPEFTALENVCIPGFIQGRTEPEVREAAKELLNYLGLSDRLDHKPDQLSGGEQQRVAIARALINKPKVIFADEPTGNLDSQTSEELHELIFRLRNDFNQTFVIVTHNLELANMSDRVLTMEDGQIKGS